MEKRGQGLSTSAIILIILGVVVLVVLIAGFTIGWGALKDYISPSNNLGRIQHECNTLCTTGGEYSYCAEEKIVEIKGQKEIKGTCSELQTMVDGKGKSLGIDKCLQINCDDYEIKFAENEAEARFLCIKSSDLIVNYLVGNQKKIVECEEKDIPQDKNEAIERCTEILKNKKTKDFYKTPFDIYFVKLDEDKKDKLSCPIASN